MSVKSLADEILKRAVVSGRFIVAIAGPPGAGKSTLSETLAEASYPVYVHIACSSPMMNAHQ